MPKVWDKSIDWRPPVSVHKVLQTLPTAIGVVKTQYFETEDTGPGLDDQVKQEPLGL